MSECTGLTAVWCPNHGDCTCGVDPDPKDSYDCPLHSPDSDHAETAQSLVAVSPEVARLIEAVGADNLPALLRAVHDIAEWAEPCWFDHHGLCQAHWLSEPPCPWGVLREYRERLGEALGGGT